uniref:Actin-related protein 10 n=1 Tax=Acrobeloides nanus TaxID=290746 RepID=A0A914DIW8_9BILA
MNPTPAPVFDKNLDAKEKQDRLTMFLKFLILKKLLSSVKDRRVVIVESLLSPEDVRDAIAKSLFESPSLGTPSILFAPSHLLCTFPFNAKVALVVDVGYNEAVLFPVWETIVMLNNWQAGPLGSARVEQNIQKLLLKLAKIRCYDNSVRQFEERDLELIEKNYILEDICVRFCFATTRERGLKIQLNAIDNSIQIDASPPDVELPFGTEMLILPGYIREAAAEVIFTHGDVDSRSLPQLILDTVVKCPVDLRKVFLKNLLVVGGLARMPGFLARLKSELLWLMANEFSLLDKINDVQFYRYPQDINLELYCSWLGGSMFGSLEILQSRSLSREEWLLKKKVPDWTKIIDDYTIPPHVNIHRDR